MYTFIEDQFLTMFTYSFKENTSLFLIILNYNFSKCAITVFTWLMTSIVFLAPPAIKLNVYSLMWLINFRPLNFEFRELIFYYIYFSICIMFRIVWNVRLLNVGPIFLIRLHVIFVLVLFCVDVLMIIVVISIAFFKFCSISYSLN